MSPRAWRYSRANRRYTHACADRVGIVDVAGAAREAIGTLGLLIVCAPGAAVAYKIMVAFYELGGLS